MTVSAAPPVTARIAEIRSRFESPTAEAASADSASFAELLTGALGGGTDLLTALLGGLEAGATGPDATTGGTGDLGQQVVDLAEEYQGIPYLWGGTDPEVGLDCSGFVQHVFRRVGIDLPRVSRDQALEGRPVASLEEARPGDLLAFGSPVNHVAIYVGDGKMIEAPHRGGVVRITEVDRTPSAIRRLVPESTSPAAAGGLVGTAPAGGSTLAAADPALARYAPLFNQAGARYGLDPDVLAAVAKVESGGNPNAVSSAGARGLMQFMPATARSYGIDPLDPAQAIDAAAKMLTQQRDAFGGSLELALAAYNAGPGAVRRYGGVPPYSQTQNYVRKITAMLRGHT